MQGAFAALVGILAVAVVTFVAMGLRQVRRTNALAREAHGLGMLFADDDTPELPRRYADFALLRGGHSNQAHNVAHGRLDALAVRAFDLRQERGHGTRRATRHYSVVAVEMPGQALPELLMWNDRDAEWAPLEAAQVDGRLGPWAYCGSRPMAAFLSDLCGGLGERGISVQVRGRVVMFFLPVQTRGPSYADLFDRLVRPLAATELPDGRARCAPADDTPNLSEGDADGCKAASAMIQEYGRVERQDQGGSGEVPCET